MDKKEKSADYIVIAAAAVLELIIMYSSFDSFWRRAIMIVIAACAIAYIYRKNYKDSIYGGKFNDHFPDKED